MKTSWGSVASWYDKHLEGPDTYHTKVILPNLSRLMDIKKGQTVLDLACGQGFFSKAFAEAGADVTGIDISPELIIKAKERAPQIRFTVSPADDLSSVETGSQDTVTLILAVQNIAEVKGVFAEVRRVLKQTGTFFIVMNHPAFRIPKRSSWEWDQQGKEYRRIDAYLSESRETIIMNPGGAKKENTISFHRSLQYYSKLLQAAGFATIRIEEWISHRKSEKGPRSAEEDRTRKEIPLFLYLEMRPFQA